MMRTHSCGELTAKQVKQEAVLCGWIDTRRDHGKLIFLDLRDRWGKTQLVFDPEKSKALHQAAEKLRSEFVVRVEGVVENRPEGTVNKKLATGQIELRVTKLEILNASETPPFEILDQTNVSEELRLKYRYLDLRRAPMFERLQARHKLSQDVRTYFNQHGFVEIETPILTKSTPEGARDFLVPSRLSSGAFYALPQSPQLFKQILMVSGVDRYYQVARCFRDEDLRADRQYEHTQIDVEMSFVSENDVIKLIEGLLVQILKQARGVNVKTPFERLSYQDVMNRFGSDKPDLRFDLELVDITDIFFASKLKIFKAVVEAKGAIKGIKVSGREFSRHDFDLLTTQAQEFGAKGLAWFKVADQGFESPIAKFLSSKEEKTLKAAFQAKTGDTLFIVADEWLTTCTVLGALRNHFARELELLRRDEFKLLWVVDFPMFQWNEDENRLVALHHPFTAPKESDVELLDSDPSKVHAQAYDIVLNGTEIGGGSIRIHHEEVQKKVFSALKISDADAKEKFGFLLEALRFGAPPHGGIALGLDRLSAMLAGVDSIREVIAFPKTQKGTCLMTEAPSKVYPKQLKELSLQVKS